MPYYRSAGEVPRKRHLRVDHPTGVGFLHEELLGAEGFAQESALLYHRTSPSALVAAEAVDDGVAPLTVDRPLLPRHLRTGGLEAGGDPVLGRRRLLGNDDVTLSWVQATESSGLYRNAVGDELVFVHSGSSRLDTPFGSLDLRAGDYVVVPAGVTQRWVLTGDVPLEALVLEAVGHVSIPERYLTDQGQLKEGAPYSERDIRGPEHPLAEEGTDVPVLVRNRGGLSRLVHAFHPFDVVSWDGCLYPWSLSIHDFEPIAGTIHQPPPIHQTFAGPQFVVCSFVPRPVDFHPEALKVPYHHSNVDSDEVLFYADGEFMSRSGSGIGRGSLSYHPAGFVHGPQPGSVLAMADADATDETAVMIDTFRPLLVSDLARSLADPDYLLSWSRGAESHD